jgi:hypothetical protein
VAIQVNGQHVGPIKFTDDKAGKTIHVGPSTPANPVDGDLWIDSDALNNAGKNLISSTALTSGSTKTIAVSADYKDLYVVIRGMTVTASASLIVRLNGDSGSNYYDSSGNPFNYLFNINSIKPAVTTNSFHLNINDTQDSVSHMLASVASTYTSSINNLPTIFISTGLWGATSALTSVVLTLSTGAFSGGTLLVYGAN